MTNEQILKKAIEQWYGKRIPKEHGLHWSVIFSHDFAKAIWGEEKITEVLWCEHEIGKIAWHYHLQQLVLEKEPLKYIKQFL